MNKIEKALMHALFVHLHHNIDKAIDFSIFKKLNQKVGQTWPAALLVGPDANDDAEHMVNNGFPFWLPPGSQSRAY